MTYWLVYFLILFVGSGGLFLALVRLSRMRQSRPILEKMLLVGLSLFLTLMGMELYLKAFFAQSDAVPTLAGQNWRQWYHPPEAFNSLGYRDVEWTDEMVAGKTKVMLAGDSFVQGINIKNPEDRFSDLLGQKLGEDYVVFNLGRGGANTKDEIEAIINYPYRPDILILSYFLNDIEGEPAWERGLSRPMPAGVSPYLRPLVDNSYAVNFFYWRIVRLDTFLNEQPGIEADPLWLWFRSLYDHPQVWWLHQQELLSIYEGAKVEGTPLIVVVFPSLPYLEDTKVITDRVVNLFEERGVPTVDVADLVKDIPTRDLLASPVDPHPSELVHELVADALYKKFIELGLAQ